MPSREWNEAFLLTSSYRKEISDFILTPAFMWRRHIDKYVLKADNPDFYKNNHTNDLIATLINLRYKNLALGFETRDEYLDSSGMGKHYRQILSYFGEYTYKPHTSILFSAGARYEGIFIPRLSLGWWINENIKLRSAWGKSFRRPTFTDLYYISSANFGNENLKLEKAENFEIGFDLKFSDKLKFKTTLFYRKFKDLIDWAGDTEEGPWRAGNRGKQDLNGINTNIEYNFNSVKYTLGYSYVDIKKDTDYYSKYALKYLRHRISFLAEIYLFAGVSFNISGEWGIPVQRAEESFGKMNCVLKKNFDEVEVFLKIENIGNSKYSDFSGIPVPGRWITAGINW